MSELKPLITTVIGSMQKPDYLKIPCWIEKDGEFNMEFITKYNNAMESLTQTEMDNQILRATKEVLEKQQSLDLDIITDGEVRRNGYILDFCRNIEGIDFKNLKKKFCRNGSWAAFLPSVISAIHLKSIEERSDPKDEWEYAQKLTSLPVKFTLPGPMTIYDTVVNCFYEDEEVFCEDLARMINLCILDLAKQGCKYIQIDETALVRFPKKANKYGIRLLEQCFEGVPDDVVKIVHVCCGNPEYADQDDFQKGELNGYMDIADALDRSCIDQISIEDAHRRNPKELLEKFKNKTIILGVIDVGINRIESVDEIRNHILDVLHYIPRERLVIAPDCGLLFLSDDVMERKLRNMVIAAKSV